MAQRKTSAQINFRVDPAFARRLAKAAKLTGRSIGMFLREAAEPEIVKALAAEPSKS